MHRSHDFVFLEFPLLVSDEMLRSAELFTYLGGGCGAELRLVVDPAVWTGHRPVSPLAALDRAGAELVLSLDPEGPGVGAVLWAPEGAAVRRRRRDEIVQEEVEGEDGAGEAQDAQRQELERGEAADVVEDVLEAHGGDGSRRLGGTGR